MPPPPALSPFAGAVLCGGASRRMGRDKALIVVDGRPLAVRVADALAAAGADPVVAVGGDLVALRSAGLAAVPDLEAGGGPVGGIVTALGAAATGRPPARRGEPAGPGADGIVFVGACDLIDPSADAVVAVVAALAADPAADVAVALVDGRRQWVHAAWRRRAGEPLAAAFAAGDRAVHGAVAAAGLRVVDVPLGREAAADADTPADLPTDAGPGGGPGGGTG